MTELLRSYIVVFWVWSDCRSTRRFHYVWWFWLTFFVFLLFFLDYFFQEVSWSCVEGHFSSALLMVQLKVLLMFGVLRRIDLRDLFLGKLTAPVESRVINIDEATFCLDHLFYLFFRWLITIFDDFAHVLDNSFLQLPVSVKWGHLYVVHSNVYQRVLDLFETLENRVLQVLDWGLDQCLNGLIIHVQTSLDTSCVLNDLENIRIRAIVKWRLLIYFFLHIFEYCSELCTARLHVGGRLTLNNFPVSVDVLVHPARDGRLTDVKVRGIDSFISKLAPLLFGLLLFLVNLLLYIGQALFNMFDKYWI